MLYPYDPLCVLAKRTMILPAKSPSFGWLRDRHQGPLAVRMTPNGWLLLGSWLDNGRLVDGTIIISNHITHWN